MVLNPSLNDPYFISGVLINSSSPEFTSDLQSQLHFRLYFDSFVFYSSDPAQEELFKTLLQEKIKVEFMANVE